MEELGASARLDRIGKLPASEKTGQEFIIIYRGECDGPFAFTCEEISAVEFFPTEIVERWMANKPEDFAPGFLECWRLSTAKSSQLPPSSCTCCRSVKPCARIAANGGTQIELRNAERGYPHLAQVRVSAKLFQPD